MPKIKLSTRVVNPVLPNVRAGLGMETEAKELRGLARQIDRDAIASMGIIDRVKEQDARMAAVEWEKALRQGMVAAAERDWSDYDKKGDNPLRMLGDIERDFQSSDAYKQMDGLAKRKFANLVNLRKQEYFDKFRSIYDRKREDKEKFYDNEADELGKAKLRDATFLDDAEFDKVNAEVVNDVVDRKFRRMNKEHPEVAKTYNFAKLEALRQNRLGRVKMLADAGADGTPKIVDGVLQSNTELIDRAQKYLDKLVADGIIGDGEKSTLERSIFQARSNLDHRTQNEMRAYADNAIVKAYDEGGLAGMEETRKNLLEMAKTFPKGSTSETIALDEAKKIDKAADERVALDLMNGLAEDREYYVTKDGKREAIFDPDSREARLLPKIEASARKDRLKDNRAPYLDELRFKMIECASSANPQAFNGMLVQAFLDGAITKSDVMKLQSEYNTGWLKGFNGMENEQPRQMKVAGELLDVIKTQFGVDFGAAIQKTSGGDIKLDADGKLMADDKAAKPVIEYESTKGERTLLSRLNFFASPREKETIPFDKMKEVLDTALSLAMADGAEVPFDPVTGERTEKTHVINAVADFNAWCEHLKTMEKVDTAANELAARAAVMEQVRQWAQANSPFNRIKGN